MQRVFLIALVACIAAIGVNGQSCTSNANCGATQQCVLQQCVTYPSGTNGGVCLSGNTCNQGLSCTNGFCYMVSGVAAGTLGGNCNAGACNTGLNCVLNICQSPPNLSGGSSGPSGMSGPPPSGMSGSSGPPPSGMSGPPPSGMSGMSGASGLPPMGSSGMPPIAPTCAVDSDCALGLVCHTGLCVLPLPKTNCSIPCRVDYGEVCDFGTGLCVPGVKPQCPNCNGTCAPPLFAGQPPVCLVGPNGGTLQPCQVQTDCSNLPGNNICTHGVCAQCGDICQGLANATGLTDAQRNGLLQALGQMGGGGNFNQFQPPAGALDQLRNGTEMGRLQPRDGQLLQLNGSFAGQLQNLDFQAGANAGAQLQQGQQLGIPRINANGDGGSVLLGQGAQLTAQQLNVPQDGSLTLSLTNGADPNHPSIAAFQSLNISGPINVFGGGNTVFQFPPPNGNLTLGAGGQVNLNGGVNLRGDAQGVPIQIAGSGNQPPIANIEPGQTFMAQGNIIGSGATLNVTGRLVFGGGQLQPQLQLGPGASARIQGPQGSGDVLCGNVTFGGAAAGLEIQGAPADGGARVFFDNIMNCPADATVKYFTPNGTLPADAITAGITVMNYAAIPAANRAQFKCAIQVCNGETGADCVSVTNPNNPTAASRRLFATSTATSDFSSTSLTITSSSSSDSSSGTYSAASSISATSMMMMTVLAMLVASVQRMM